MVDVPSNFIFIANFIPHGHCYLWQRQLVGLHLVSDLTIALAYYSIPATLVYFVHKRKDLPFNWIFLLFGAFIILCGSTHVMEIWTLWHPSYWQSGFLKAITAIVSVITAITLIPLVPKALALPSPAQLEVANRALMLEISDRQKAQEQLQRSETHALEQAEQLRKTLLELQQSQTQLIQSEKMSSLGQMVAGIAHEINNPINFIYGNLIHADEYIKNIMELIKLFQENYPQPVSALQEKAEAIELNFLMEDLPNMLSSMQVGAERIRQIVVSLRNFSRLDESEMKAVDIHEGIDNTLLILQHKLKATVERPEIKVIKKFHKLPLVSCYPGQLNQVFMNIISNAIDALEEFLLRGKDIKPNFVPTVEINTECRKNYIIVRIADNGPGMTEEVKKRLFDPFFTTKPIGKGTGLGLSISYQIVQKHHGELLCCSELGYGTEFSFKLPN